MQGIYSYASETNDVSRVCNFASILWLKFVVHVTILLMINIFYFYSNTLRSTCAVPNIVVFCSSLISFFPVCRSNIS
jgi:hypothetical protein